MKKREDGTLCEIAWNDLDSCGRETAFILAEACLTVVTIICVILIVVLMTETLDVVLDPEYWAISQIFRMLKASC